MAKLQLPSGKFERELIPSSLTAVKKATEAGTESMLMIDPRKIEPIEGFNVRVEDAEYRAHIESLKASIRANGFYPNKPLGGFLGKEGDTAAAQLTDGYSRFRAVMELIEEGVEIERVPFVAKPAGTTLEDLIVALVQDNEGRPLSVFERALVVKRLVGLNMEEAKIAERLNITPRYVSDLLLLAGAPAKVRALVVTGKVAPTEAVKQLRKDPAKATEVLSKAVELAEARGKTKATAKDTKSATAPKADKKPVKRKSGMSASVTTRNGRVYQTLSYYYKAGDILPVDDTFKAVRLFRDADWWNFVDPQTKADFVVEETIEITVSMEYQEPADEDDTFADPKKGAKDDAEPRQIAQEAPSGDEGSSDTEEGETAATEQSEGDDDL